MISKLHRSGWIDENTAVMFLEVNLYTPNVNLLTIVTGIVEKPSYGGFIKSHSVNSMKLYRYTDNMFVFVVTCEALYVLYILYFTVTQILIMKRERMKYFYSLWNLLELVIIHTSFGAIVTYALHAVKVNKVVSNYKANRERFTSFHEALNLDFILLYLIAFLVMLATVKLLRLLGFNPKMRLFNETLSQVWTSLASFILMLFIMFIATGTLYYISYGHVLEDYRSFPKSLGSLFLALLCEFDYYTMMDVNTIWAPYLIVIFSFFSSFIVFCLLISALIQTFSRLSKTMKANKDDELLAVAWIRLKELVGFKEDLDSHMHL